MLLIAFIAGNRKIIKFSIEGKVVKYFDDSGINLIFPKGLQILPKDQNTIEKLRRSRKQTLKVQAALILDANKGKNLKDYEKCCSKPKEKIEEALADMIRMDCKIKGIMEVK